jgi:hypothetical protein
MLLCRDPSRRYELFLGVRDAEVGVALLPAAGLGFGATGPERLAPASLIVSAICVSVR